MADSFDPYHVWLGIRDPRRPPNHYRLLGLDAFEDDPNTISGAADRQIAHVRSFQNTQHAFHSQRLLGEIATARLCLLDPVKKRGYDAALKSEAQQLEAQAREAQRVAQQALQQQAAQQQQALHPAAWPPAPANMPMSPVPQRAFPNALAPSAPMAPAPASIPAAVPGPALAPAAASANEDDDPEYVFQVKIPPAAYVLGVGLVGMAIFASIRMFLDNQAKQAELAAQNAPPPPPVIAASMDPAKKSGETVAAPVVLPPSAAALPASARTHVLRGHVSPVLGADLSVDGTRAISAGEDKTIRWWKLADNQPLGEITRHTDVVTSVVFARDGYSALSASLDKSVRVWDLEAKQQSHRLLGHTAGVTCAVYLPDERTAISGSLDTTLRMWDLKKGELLRTLEGHKGSVHCVAVSPDARRAASGAADGTLRVWDLEGGSEVASFEVELRGVTAVAWSSDSRELLYGGSTGNLYRLDAAGVELTEYLGHTGRVRGVALLDDGRALSASEDGTLRIWSRDTGEELQRYELADGAALRNLAVGADQTMLLTAGSDSSVHAWQLRPMPTLFSTTAPAVLTDPIEELGQIRVVLKAHTGAVTDVGFSPDGKLMASVGIDGVIRILDVTAKPPAEAEKKAEPVKTEPAQAEPEDPAKTEAPAAAVPRPEKIAASQRPLRAVAFSPDGKQVLAGGDDGRVALWDVATGQVVRTFPGHRQSPIVAARFGKGDDGQPVVLSADRDRAVMIWDPVSGQELRRVIGAGFGDRWAFWDDSKQVISASFDRTVRVWDCQFGRDLLRLKMPEDGSYAECVAATRDGKRILSGGPDKIVRVWDVAERREVLRCRGHEKGLARIVVSRDGKRALTSGHDQFLKLWDLASGRSTFDFPGLPAVAGALAFSDNGKLALSGDRDGGLRVWRLPSLTEQEPDPAAVVAVMPKKADIPDEATLNEQEKEVTKEFTSGLAKLDPSAKTALAGQLFVEAMAVEDNPARRYALLAASRDVALSAGDLPAAREAVETIVSSFEVNPLAMRAEAVLQAGKTVRSDDMARVLESQAVQYGDEALAAGDFETTTKLNTLLTTLSRRVGGNPLTLYSTARAQRMKALKADYDRQELSTSHERLAREPADATANLALGKFAAYQLADWDRAWPMLVLGADADLRELAAGVLSEPTLPADQLALAKRFTELAVAFKASDKPPAKGEKPAPKEGKASERLAEKAAEKAAAQQLYQQAYVWASRAAAGNDDAVKLEASDLALACLGEFVAKITTLSALPPESVRVGLGTLGTGGKLGYDAGGQSLVFVGGDFTPDAISMHPADNASARVVYRLHKQFGQFQATVALADTAAQAPLAAPVVFRLLGDGTELFRSQPFEKAGEIQKFVVDLSGVDKLELTVTAGGSNLGAHAVWLEPKLSRAR